MSENNPLELFQMQNSILNPEPSENRNKKESNEPNMKQNSFMCKKILGNGWREMTGMY